MLLNLKYIKEKKAKVKKFEARSDLEIFLILNLSWYKPIKQREKINVEGLVIDKRKYSEISKRKNLLFIKFSLVSYTYNKIQHKKNSNEWGMKNLVVTKWTNVERNTIKYI